MLDKYHYSDDEGGQPFPADGWFIAKYGSTITLRFRENSATNLIMETTCADAAQEEEVTKAFENLMQLLGGVDIIVANRPVIRKITPERPKKKNMTEENTSAAIPNKAINQQVRQTSFVETEEERRARLNRPIGVSDVALVKQYHPDIPDDFLLRMMFGVR